MPRRCVIIGNDLSLFPRQLAAAWRARGLDPVIVTDRPGAAGVLPDGTRVLSTHAASSAPADRRELWTARVLERVRSIESVVERSRARRAMGGDSREPASFVPPLAHARRIARLAESVTPKFVFGQEAFAYGPATAACRGVPRILMPWGGDVFLQAESSAISFALVRHALRSVDLVCPSSVTAASQIRRRFEVAEHRVRAVSWGVDTLAFRRAAPDTRADVCRHLGLDPGVAIVMSVRRFFPGWGSEEVLDAFLRVAVSYTAGPLAFLVLGGAGSERFVTQARERVAAHGLAGRFRFFDGDISLARCAELMSIADVFVSLMRARDMRSASILQAAAAGGAGILSDQEEYREMARRGFIADFVDPLEPLAVSRAILGLLEDPGRREDWRRRNRVYVETHERADRQMDVLLAEIERVCTEARAQHGAALSNPV